MGVADVDVESGRGGPRRFGLHGDNILTSDFSGVTFTDATHFVDNGFLQVTSFQLGGNTFTPTGLNSSYGLWFRFQATGHLKHRQCVDHVDCPRRVGPSIR